MNLTTSLSRRHLCRIAEAVALKGWFMWWFIVRTGIAAVVIATVSGIAERSPRWGALLLTLPIVSIIAFVMTWTQHRDLPTISRLAKETLVLVPLGLPFFVPLAFAERLGLSFWPAFAIGLALATGCIAAWFQLSN
jgi:hypothetical protein